MRAVLRVMYAFGNTILVGNTIRAYTCLTALIMYNKMESEFHEQWVISSMVLEAGVGVNNQL